jgi:iron complex outermembrane receptor protein
VHSVLAVALLSTTARAQDSASTRLAPIRVTVSRDVARSTLDLPFSVSRLSFDSARVGARRGSLTELLIAIPGLAISNRHNPTQDPRLAIRGFGARSAFGIRGVRIVRDGVPLTLADGQTAVDFVDLETLGSAEVMRGAAGALYGNAAGGILELRTQTPPVAGWRAGVRAVANEDARRWSGHAAGSAGEVGWQATVSRNTADGPRDYARFRSTAFSGDARRTWDDAAVRLSLTGYESPLGENPGAVTAAELGTVPWVADSQNIRRAATKTVRHRLLSVQGERGWDGGGLSATLFGGTRHLSNPQAFAIVDFARRFMGVSARAQHSAVVGRHVLRVAVGADVQSMRDDRQNYVNCVGNTASACQAKPGIARGALTLDQLEKVAAAGVFVRGEVSRSMVSLTATLRGDRTGFTVNDRRVTSVPGGTLLSRNMGAVTPMVGLTVKPSARWSLFANMANSFETPTTTELANQPNGQTGINRDLKPQRARTLELGFKGVAGRVMVDASAFNIATTDELIPFEIPNSGGRRYFRNAGKTARRGVELGWSASLGPVDLGGALATIDYEYDRFTVGTTVLDGKKVPGVAPTTASLFATLRRAHGFATLEMQQASRTEADDANINAAPGYVLWNARIGLHAIRGVAPTIGVENLFDRAYAANVVTNATRGRFFEPGAERRVYVGVSVRGGR